MNRSLSQAPRPAAVVAMAVAILLLEPPAEPR
jgi:hypothetical protein